MKISVLIITRNRADDLSECLELLCQQTMSPYEVILVDNNSDDNTAKQIADLYRGKLNVRYFKEIKTGRPYARNKGLSEIKGNIVAFLDDDCVVDKNWIKYIDFIFKRNINISGIIGFSTNYYEKNTYSQIEQFFYIRWLKKNLSAINKINIINTGSLVDTKNSAFLVSIIKDVKFSTDQLVNEDVEFGSKVFLKNRKMLFIPTLNVKHKNSLSPLPFFKKNYIKGYYFGKLNKVLTSSNKSIKQDNFYRIFSTYFQSSTKMRKLELFILTFFYVILYKIGFIQSNTENRVIILIRRYLLRY